MSIPVLVFIHAECVKFVARLQKMLLVLGITDFWRSGTKEDFLVLVQTHQREMSDVGGDSHFATS